MNVDWIAPEIALPNEDDPILVVCKVQYGPPLVYAAMRTGGRWVSLESQSFGEYDSVPGKVVAWMPYPDPPKVQE